MSEPAAPQVEPMLTTREVARILQVSSETVYKLVRNGELPAYRVGDRSGGTKDRRGWRYRRAEVEEFLTRVRIKPDANKG